jgi:histidinol-phosphatase (PHP family)
MISMHSHSGQFCLHAKGSLEEVIQEAIKKRFKTYGLTEHMPRFSRSQLYPEESQLSPSDLVQMFHEYVQEARKLAIKYKNEINILIGMETEFIDYSFKNEIENLRTIYGLDYVVGSLHHVRGIPIDFNEELFNKARDLFQDTPEPTLALFEAYFEEHFEMLKMIKPEVVGHFDLIRLFKPDKQMLTPKLYGIIDRSVDFVVSYGGLFEINTRGWKKTETCYPMSDIVKRIAAKGGRFTVSDDSHGPSDVGMHYDKLKEFLLSHNIREIYYLTRNGASSTGLEQDKVLVSDFFPF